MRTCGRLVAAWLLLTIVQAALAQDKDSQPFREPATGVVFPKKLGEWDRGKTSEFGKGLGVSIGYNSKPASATLYVYNLNLKSIPPGTSPAVKSHFEQTKKDVHTAQSRLEGSATLKSEAEVRLGKGEDSPKALQAIYVLKDKAGEEAVSHLYLTGYRNQFFKVRVSYPKKDQATCEPMVEKLMRELGAMLKK